MLSDRGDSYTAAVSLGCVASEKEESVEQRVDGWERCDRVKLKCCLLSENTSLRCSPSGTLLEIFCILAVV